MVEPEHAPDAYEQAMDDPEFLTGECPGGLAWDCCHADDCGVTEDGQNCWLATPAGG